MAGAHMFQAVQHTELDTLGLVAIRDFLKKRHAPASRGAEQQGGRRQHHADHSGGLD
jgi:hypothetical protein